MNTRLKLAYTLAEYAHEGQKRKGGYPYIYHPWAVAEAVKHLGEDYQITGVLHDVIEDTFIGYDTIDNLFGGIIARAVDSVTKESYGFQEELYSNFVLRAKQNTIGRQVKIADIKHNLSTADGIPLPERVKLITKWEEGLRVLLSD